MNKITSTLNFIGDTARFMAVGAAAGANSVAAAGNLIYCLVTGPKLCNQNPDMSSCKRWDESVRKEASELKEESFETARIALTALSPCTSLFADIQADKLKGTIYEKPAKVLANLAVSTGILAGSTLLVDAILELCSVLPIKVVGQMVDLRKWSLLGQYNSLTDLMPKGFMPPVPPVGKELAPAIFYQACKGGAAISAVKINQTLQEAQESVQNPPQAP